MITLIYKILYKYFTRFLSTEKIWELEIKLGYVDGLGKPKKCRKCGCKYFQTKYTDIMDGGLVCEYEYICENCDSVQGVWSYGHWQV